MYYDRIQPKILFDFLLEPTHTNLRRLLLSNTGETDFLDFKLKWIDLSKLAKHVLAIANSGGGCIIVGVDQNEDGSIELVGLSSSDFLDKADVDNKLDNYLPKWLRYRTEDYVFDGSISDPFTGKTFQVLFIEYDPRYVPFTSVVSRGELRYGAIYLRQGTKSIEATSEKLVDIVLRKVQSGGSTSPTVSLSEHLAHLKTLYSELETCGNLDYCQYVHSLISAKKVTIEDYLRSRSRTE